MKGLEDVVKEFVEESKAEETVRVIEVPVLLPSWGWKSAEETARDYHITLGELFSHIIYHFTLSNAAAMVFADLSEDEEKGGHA